MGDVPVLPGGSTPQQGMGSPSQLPPVMEERTAGAGDPSGEGDLVPAVEEAGSTSACTDSSAEAETSPWEGAPLESCEPPLPIELLCHGMEEISPASWAKELARPDEDVGSLQKHQEAEKEERGLHSSSPKEGQTSASAETLSQTSPGAEESWDMLFNDDGDCLDPRLLEEVLPASQCLWGFVGMVTGARWEVGDDCSCVLWGECIGWVSCTKGIVSLAGCAAFS